MSHCLDLIVPAVPDLPGLEDRAAAWLGEEEEASARPYRWGPDVELRAYPVAESPYRGLHRLPPGFVGADWKVVAVEAPSLRGTRYPAGEDPLETLLRGLLTRCDRWALVFSVECEQVDAVHPSSVDAALDRLRGGLAGPHREGFIACGPEFGERDP